MPVDNLIHQCNERLKFHLKTLNQPMRQIAEYALFPGGKRLRPALLLSTAESFGANMQAAYEIACAIECIHTYSLIHDDLPAIDNDDYRRGKLALHRRFQEGQALLCGDLLLTMAFEIVANVNLPADERIQTIKFLTQYSGSHGLIAGQISDLNLGLSQNPSQWLTYLNAASLKTGAMFTCALQCGAQIGKVRMRDFLLLQKIGESFGILYQLVDDLQDQDPIPSPWETIEETCNELLGFIYDSISQLSVDHPFLHEFLETFRNQSSLSKHGLIAKSP